MKDQNAELAKLVKDAMRYRWLREAQVIDWDCLNSRCVGEVEHSDAAWDEVGVRIDETVDWAMRSNAKVSGADTASAGLPGCAANGTNDERTDK